MRRTWSFAPAAWSAIAAMSLAGACSRANESATPGSGDRGARDRGPPEAGYVVMRPQSVGITTDLPGRTSAYEVSEVRPQVTGVILARRFEEGAVVRAGQTLYQIDPSLYEASAEQAQANLRAAQASQRAASSRAVRLEPLMRANAVSRQEFTDAAAGAEQGEASVAQNRAALKTARINLRFTRVPAPITGRIGRSNVTTGALVTANQTAALTTIQRLDRVYVDIQQSNAALLTLRQSMQRSGADTESAEVRLTLPGGSAYPLAGRVQFTEATVDPATGAVTLRASFPNPGSLLLPGMFVHAHIVQRTVDGAFLVPQQALLREEDGTAAVMVVGVDRKAIRRPVVAEQTFGDKWVVTDGLSPGDRVIVEGLGRVRAGEAVKPVPAGSRPQGGRSRRGGA